MAETIADSGHPGHQDDANLFEIDFDETAGPVILNDDLKSVVMEQDQVQAADDIDFQLDQYEVVDEAGDQSGNGHTAVTSGDSAPGELAVPPTDTAESEIGYEDEEPPQPDTAGHEIEATAQEQGQQEDVSPTDNVDEIDYEDGEFAAAEGDNNATEETEPPFEPSEEQVAAREVLTQQVLDNNTTHTDLTADLLEDDEASMQEAFDVGQQLGQEDDTASHTGAYPEDPSAAPPSGEHSDVLVHYNGVKYELCASLQNEDPETYFFAGTDEMDLPLSEFFRLLRDVIKDEIWPSDELVIELPQLKLEFGEGSTKEFLSQHTFRSILDLFRRLKHNEGDEDDHAQLLVELVAKPNCLERYTMLVEAADAGRGWSALFDSSDDSDNSSGPHSEEGFGGEHDLRSGEDQSGDHGDDLQRKLVQIIKEAYFYDETNEGGEVDAEDVFDAQGAEDQSHDAGEMDELHGVYDLDGELVEKDDFDQYDEEADDTMGDAQDDTAPQTSFDDDRGGSAPHDGTGNESVAAADGAATGDAAGNMGDNELDSFNDQAGSALGASNILESGNDPFSFHTLSDPPPRSPQEFLDEFLELDPDTITPEMWKMFDELPRSLTQSSGCGAAGGEEEKLFDYSDDEDASGQPEMHSTRPLNPAALPTLSKCLYGQSPRESIAEESDVELDDGFTRYEQDHRSSSVSESNSVRSVVEGDGDILSGAEHGRSNYSPTARSGFVLETGFRYSQSARANFSDPEAHQEHAVHSDAGIEPAHGEPTAHDDLEDDGGNDLALNEESIDLEGYATFDETTNHEPEAAEPAHPSDSHGTGSTSTVDGDEITYEDDNVALDSTEAGTLGAGDAASGNVDEIDWEHDGAEDVALAEEPTNTSSPSGLFVKRGREADDLSSLDDENDAKRRKI